MPKLTFEVEVKSDDKETDLEYLKKLHNVFVKITELHSWGYTDDEYLASSSLDIT